MPKFDFSLDSWMRIPIWVAEPRLFWLFVGGIVIASIASSWIGAAGDWIGIVSHDPRLDRIRYAGWLLEIFGLISVAVGLSRKLDLYHGKNAWALFKDRAIQWSRRFPLLSRDRKNRGGWRARIYWPL